MVAALAIPPPLTIPTPTIHHHQSTTKPHHNYNQALQTPTPPSEQVYTALIQTYLNLLCYDNATFLAERNAASFPNSENAIYLLAYCHYRGGSAKSARSLLLNRWLGRNDTAAAAVGGTHGDTNNTLELERTRSSARYLLAKSCYDLGLYGEAEEALLRHCRQTFARAVSDGGGVVNGVKIRGNRNAAMDAWIVQLNLNSSNSSSTAVVSPIPNGSAGLHLLGNICRKTNRRQRAMEYYRLSLKLDPLLWTSYQAICELGGNVEGRVDMADDPNDIFGVDAPVLSPRHAGQGAMMGRGGGFRGAAAAAAAVDRSLDETSNASASVTSEQHTNQSLHSFQMNRYGTPSTPYSGFGKMNIGSYSNSNTSAQQQQQLYPTIATDATTQQGGVNFHLPATASTIAPRTRGSMADDTLPQTNLFAATPALSQKPSLQSPEVEPPPAASGSASFTVATPGNTVCGNGTAPPSAIGYANQVLDRARRVVAGLTYEPSPESIAHRPPMPTTQRKARFATELTFSSTPLPRDGDDGPGIPFHAGVSTVKGEKRALFSTGGGDGLSRKKSTKEEESPALAAEQGGGDGGVQTIVGLDEVTESVHVGKVLELLCGLGAAYRYLCQYRSQDALELFRELPSEQINTGWVQHQIGKAYFEMSDYQNAQRALQTMRKVEPHRIKGLDILSTTLWQLKKEVELSDLAQQAVDFERMAPEAWFIVGNCFSLQKEHETAVTFFRRSIQLNPSYTYAHTLCGHEFTSNEDFEKAISCYRDAIRVDSRHYNAWYGLGAIYFRQEKFDLAEYHFQRALDINSQSSVLHCHLGMAQHQNGKTMEALDTLAGAFRLDPRNPQAHYQRATIFMTLDRPEDALSELEKVRSAAPKEASVHFNMGKVYKRLGQPAKAMRCFLTALDLDPKDNNLIKAAMDRLDEPDVEEEVSVF